MTNRVISAVLLGLTIWVNYLSSSGGLGENLLVLRDIFPFAHMPEGWTFAVAWGSIYFMLVLWCLRSWTTKEKNPITKKIEPVFWLSCVLNIIWIIFTAQEWYTRSVLIIVWLMFTLRYILDLIDQEKKEVSPLVWIPFGLYAGRVTMATTIIASSQFLYAFNDLASVSIQRTRIVMMLGIFTAGRLFLRYRNRAQLLITLIALAGIFDSMGMF